MTDFNTWENELGPEVTGIGVPMEDLSDTELDARINLVEGELLGLELEEIETGRMTPDEVAAEAKHIEDMFGDDSGV